MPWEMHTQSVLTLATTLRFSSGKTLDISLFLFLALDSVSTLGSGFWLWILINPWLSLFLATGSDSGLF